MRVETQLLCSICNDHFKDGTLMNQSQRIAIFGGGGFVGGHLVRHFAANGCHVLSMDACETDSILNEGSAIISLKLDITKKVSDVVDFKECSLIHAAAMMKGNPDLLWSVNVDGTRNVLEWGVRHQVSKVIFFSTGGVYGYRELECRENDPVSPIGVYGYTKWIGEQICRMYANEYGLRTTVFRLYFPFGPFPNTGIFSFIFESIRKGSALTVHAKGSPRFKPIHVDDIAAACSATMLSPESLSGYHVYNLCGDETLGFYDIIRIFEKRQGRKAVMIQSPQNQMDLIADNSKLKKVGWRPRHSIRELESLPFPD